MAFRRADHLPRSQTKPKLMMVAMTKRTVLKVDRLRGRAVLMEGSEV